MERLIKGREDDLCIGLAALAEEIKSLKPYCRVHSVDRIDEDRGGLLRLPLLMEPPGGRPNSCV
jgi:hypothetical protein